MYFAPCSSLRFSLPLVCLVAFLVLLVSRPWPDFTVVVVPLGVSALLAGFRQVLVTYWATFAFFPVLFLPFSSP